MMDRLSTLYQDLLGGSYDCVDRIVLNAYFRMGHNPGRFRVWWRALTGSDETLENAYLMRLAGRFSRRIRGYAKAHDIPVIDCSAGQRKHELAEEYLPKTRVAQGLYLVLVGRGGRQCGMSARSTHREKEADALCEPCSFQILDPDWGHLTIKISGHSPFPAQVGGTREGNCFTTISDAAGLAKIADTLSEHRTIGRLSQVCEQIYSCVCFALDFDQQRLPSPIFQLSDRIQPELGLEVGGCMDQVFQALIDRSRAPLDLKTIKTIVGYKRRPQYRVRNKPSAEWEVAVERPTHDLTIFKLHCGKLTLKIYTKGERVLRFEAVAHNTRQLNCGRSLDKFPEVVSRLKSLLETVCRCLSCIDQCFIADEMLEQLPTASRVGKTVVGGIDLNKARMRQVVEALIALSPSPNGFTASDVAVRVRALSKQSPCQYSPRRAAYDLKKLRGKQIVRRIGHSRRYEPLPTGLRAMTALLVLRNKG